MQPIYGFIFLQSKSLSVVELAGRGLYVHIAFTEDSIPVSSVLSSGGLVVDLMNTYLLNMSLLRWYKYEAIAR